MVKERKNEDGNGDMPVQVISGRDGKPAFAVIPFNAFAMLLALARKGTGDSPDREPRLPKLRDLEAIWKKPIESFFPQYEMTASNEDVRDWLQHVFISHGASDDDEDVAAYDDAKAQNEESFPLALAGRMIGGGNPIKVFRQHRGFTQKQLASKTETSAAYLSQIETGRRIGSIKLLRRLAGALNVEVEDLI